MTAHVFLDRLGHAFGDTHALRDVTLLAQGGITVVLGPNGSGKSTLLRCVATTLRPDTGTVTVDGLDPTRERERIELRRRLGYAPQEAGFDGRVRVFDAIDYVGVLKGLTPDRARRRSVFFALERVGLADRARDRVADLSAGMRRRLVTAQALLGTPTLLVLDEPAASLDPEERLRLREILAERRRTATVLVSTHLTDEATMADTVVVLGDGRLRFAGTPSQLAAHAAGRVWLQDGFPPPNVRASWQQADGRHRCLGSPPVGAELVAPRLEDGYLVLQDHVPVS